MGGLKTRYTDSMNGPYLLTWSGSRREIANRAMTKILKASKIRDRHRGMEQLATAPFALSKRNFRRAGLTVRIARRHMHSGLGRSLAFSQFRRRFLCWF
jgi:hypothetical protein